jgi:hypothetical protein
MLGNGTRAQVVNFLWVNGLPGVQLDYPGQLFLSERFYPLERVALLITTGIWRVERAADSL